MIYQCRTIFTSREVENQLRRMITILLLSVSFFRVCTGKIHINRNILKIGRILTLTTKVFFLFFVKIT